MSVKTLKKLMRCLAVVLIVGSLVPSLACMGRIQQAAQKAQEANDLMQLALTYHNFADSHKGKGPNTVDEFNTWAQQNAPEAAPVLSSLKSGKYVFYMGVDIINQPAGAQNTVLGYEANTPTAGGPVVMVDGSTRQMTAAEFQAATKPANAKLSKP
jgi:hypothetical protein